MAISILIYEDNDLLRENMGRMLTARNEFEVKGMFDNVANVMGQIKNFRPDIILMDIDMPGLTGIDAVHMVRAAGFKTLIMMLTVFDDSQHVFEALCAGASGYLLKKHLSARLCDSIKELQNGGAPMSPGVAQMVIRSMHKKHAKNPYNLTLREMEVLTSLSKGYSYKRVATEIGIRVDTVRSHIKNLYEKLQVHSQAEAMAKAANEKLI